MTKKSKEKRKIEKNKEEKPRDVIEKTIELILSSKPKIDPKKEITDNISRVKANPSKVIVKALESASIDAHLEFSDAKENFLEREFYLSSGRIDYAELFNYLGKSVKGYDHSYDSYASVYATLNVKDKEDAMHPKLDDRLIDEVIRAKKMKDMFGIDAYVSPMKRSVFDVWKCANSAEVKMRYDSIIV